MSNVVLPTTFDVSRVTVTAPKVNEKTGAKAAYLNYSGEKLIMQTAREMVLPFGLSIYDKNGTPEYSVEMSFRGADSRDDLRTYQNTLQVLDEHMISLGVKNSRQWFKSELNEQVIRAFYTPTLKLSKDKEGNPLPYPPTTKAKLRKINGDFEAKFYDESGVPYRGLSLEEMLVKGATVTGLLECTGVWFAGSKFGLTWKVKQMIIHHLPERIKDFAFVGFAGDTSNTSAPLRRSAPAVTASSANHVDDDETLLEEEVVDTENVAPVSKPSVLAAVMPPTVPNNLVTVHHTVDDEAGEDVEPVPVPTRKPIIKKKVIAVPKK